MILYVQQSIRRPIALEQIDAQLCEEPDGDAVGPAICLRGRIPSAGIVRSSARRNRVPQETLLYDADSAYRLDRAEPPQGAIRRVALGFRSHLPHPPAYHPPTLRSKSHSKYRAECIFIFNIHFVPILAVRLVHRKVQHLPIPDALVNSHWTGSI